MLDQIILSIDIASVKRSEYLSCRNFWGMEGYAEFINSGAVAMISTVGSQHPHLAHQTRSLDQWQKTLHHL